MNDVPTPGSVVLDLLPVLSEYKELIKDVEEFEVSLTEIVSNVLPYILEDDKADAGLADFISISYDMYLAAAENNRVKKPVTTMYEEIEIENQAYNTSMAAEIIGTQILSMLRLHKLYYNNCAYYQFSRMVDKFSPCLMKSDIHFFPF